MVLEIRIEIETWREGEATDGQEEDFWSPEMYYFLIWVVIT